MADKKDLYIYTVKAWMYDSISRNNLLDNGELEFTFGEEYYSGGNKKTATFPLTSVWLDPRRSNTICKAYGAIPQKPQTEQEDVARAFAISVLKAKGVNRTTEANDTLICSDDYLKLIRYGVDTRNGNKYFSKSQDTSEYSKQPIFESKADALAAMIEALADMSSAKLTGIDLINLGAASDNLLVELGFEMVPDMLGNGVPMWSGDPVKAVNPSSSYSEYGGYRDSYSDYGDIRKKSNKDTVEQFLVLLEQELA